MKRKVLRKRKRGRRRQIQIKRRKKKRKRKVKSPRSSHLILKLKLEFNPRAKQSTKQLPIHQLIRMIQQVRRTKNLRGRKRRKVCQLNESNQRHKMCRLMKVLALERRSKNKQLTKLNLNRDLRVIVVKVVRAVKVNPNPILLTSLYLKTILLLDRKGDSNPAIKVGQILSHNQQYIQLISSNPLVKFSNVHQLVMNTVTNTI